MFVITSKVDVYVGIFYAGRCNVRTVSAQRGNFGADELTQQIMRQPAGTWKRSSGCMKIEEKGARAMLSPMLPAMATWRPPGGCTKIETRVVAVGQW